jgi:hypothetical protein
LGKFLKKRAQFIGRGCVAGAGGAGGGVAFDGDRVLEVVGLLMIYAGLKLLGVALPF